LFLTPPELTFTAPKGTFGTTRRILHAAEAGFALGKIHSAAAGINSTLAEAVSTPAEIIYTPAGAVSTLAGFILQPPR
jgi:hypothetical protein